MNWRLITKHIDKSVRRHLVQLLQSIGVGPDDIYDLSNIGKSSYVRYIKDNQAYQLSLQNLGNPIYEDEEVMEADLPNHS